MSLPRLSDRTLVQARPGTWPGAYDRCAVEIGVVHLGPGAFHRAHQTPVFEALLPGDPRWGVCGVSLRSAAVREALSPQGGLYTLVELGRETRARIIGAELELLTAPASPQRVLQRLAEARLITLTVTEKGYCLDAAGALDLAHPDIAHDAGRPAQPRSAAGWLVEGLRSRRTAGGAGLSILSCDNLTDNGGKLGRAVVALARAQSDEALADWIEHAVRFPSSMVDSITPATDDVLRERTRALIGLEDAWPIQREAFSQWVLEDRLTGEVPDFAAAGVQLTADVRPFEQAKLRLLNGAHSTLAYLGLLAGFETVAQAMADRALAAFVERLMREDIAPALAPTADLDIPAYISAVLGRFGNPAISHRLAQIAQDGSQKLPFRLIASLADALVAGRPIERLAAPLAAWMLFAGRRSRGLEPLVDPLADRIARIAAAPTEQQSDDFLALASVFPPALAADPGVRRAIASAHASLAAGRLADVLAA